MEFEFKCKQKKTEIAYTHSAPTINYKRRHSSCIEGYYQIQIFIAEKLQSTI